MEYKTQNNGSLFEGLIDIKIILKNADFITDDPNNMLM